jgi:hypothetical protein
MTVEWIDVVQRPIVSKIKLKRSKRPKVIHKARELVKISWLHTADNFDIPRS